MGHTVGVKVQKVVAPYGAQILKKGGAAGAAGCVEGLCDRHGATPWSGSRRFKGQVPAPPLDTPVREVLKIDRTHGWRARKFDDLISSVPEYHCSWRRGRVPEEW